MHEASAAYGADGSELRGRGKLMAPWVATETHSPSRSTATVVFIGDAEGNAMESGLCVGAVEPEIELGEMITCFY